MYVELSMFSGRPNPRLRLNARQASELVARLKGRPLGVTTASRPVLGVRGFEIEPEPEEAFRYGLPPRFVIAPSEGPAAPPSGAARTAPDSLTAQPLAAEPLRMNVESEAAEWLFKAAEGVVDDDVLEVARSGGNGAFREAAFTKAAAPEEEAARGEAPLKAAQTLASVVGAAACQPFLTPMRLWYWNHPYVQPNNNCYNYASNYASHTLAQPGRWAGRVYESFECEAVRDAAFADGCLGTCEGQSRVIALAIWPGFDFHWWRMHPGGFWAQKVGWSPATNRDNQGRVIGNGLTPESCDRGPYTTFCGYFFAPLGLQVQ